jgi:hypothetical protein
MVHAVGHADNAVQEEPFGHGPVGGEPPAGDAVELDTIAVKVGVDPGVFPVDDFVEIFARHILRLYS